MDESVNTTEVNEYTVSGNILNRTLKDLTFFELGNDFFLLCFKFFFDKSLVRNNHVAELLVDFNNLELHGFANKYVVISDRMNVDLASWKEGFNSEDVNNHATFSATLDITLNNFFVFKSGVNTFPALAKACLLVRKNQLTFFVFLIFDVNLNSVADFEFGIVSEFGSGDNTVALVADVNNYFLFVNGDNSTINNLML